MRILPVVCALIVACPAAVRAIEPSPPAATKPDDGRDTNRVSIGVAAMVFASFPQSMEDDGGALVLGKPVWLGTRHAAFQWALDVDALVGFGTRSGNIYAAVAVLFGFNLYLGSVFGFELKMGPTGFVQLGAPVAPGLGLAISGGYVFRFWEDDRVRLKLLLRAQLGSYLSSDDGNDVGLNAATLGACLAFETPF